MSLVCANSISEEYVVIGVDLPSNIDVINKLNKGVFPLSQVILKFKIILIMLFKRRIF